MKFLVATILTLLLSFIGGLYFPWWIIAPVALVVAVLIPQKGFKSAAAGFLGVFLCWAGLAWWIDHQNNQVLSHKIASILPLGGNGLVLVLVTGFVGGLVAALAALTGHFARSTSK